MNAVDRTKAGVASGILSMNRMVGGTFGVAVLGALVATLGRSKIDELLPQRPLRRRAQRLAEPRLGRRRAWRPWRVIDAGQQAFVYALHYGLLLGSGSHCSARSRRSLLIRKRSEEQVEAQAGDVESPARAHAASEPAPGAEPRARAEPARARDSRTSERQALSGPDTPRARGVG